MFTCVLLSPLFRVNWYLDTNLVYLGFLFLWWQAYFTGVVYFLLHHTISFRLTFTDAMIDHWV